jgi:two-component system NarL family sensor kinase
MIQKPASIARPVLVFALSGLVAAALVAVAGAYAFRSLGTDEALKDARRLTDVTGHGIVEPALTTDVVRGRPPAIARLDRIVRRRVRSPDVVRIKVWNAEGKILYSDEPLLIGRRFPLGGDELAALRGRSTAAEVPDLSRPENAYERGQGDLTSVYLGLRAQDGTPVLFEEYLRSSAIAGNSRSLVRRFAPIGIAALLVLAALQIPLAWRMASRIRNAQRDREQLLQRTLDASDKERRSIAAGLHDGVVQELAGHSYQMTAAIEQHQPEPVLRQVLAEGAAGTRNAIRQLRSLLIEIYPPALRDHGLAAALPDLTAPLTARGMDVTVDVQPGLSLPSETEQLVFRSAQEALRNTAAHAGAGHVSVSVSQTTGMVTLLVADDGRGFDEQQLAERRTEGHLGLSIIRDLAESAGGNLRVNSQPGDGTRLELELPTR